MNECLTTPQHQNTSAVGCQTESRREKNEIKTEKKRKRRREIEEEREWEG